MTPITTKSTKAEILAAYKTVTAAYVADRAKALTPTVTAEAASNTARAVWVELVELIRDTYLLGCWCRKGFDKLVDELRVTVKN